MADKNEIVEKLIEGVPEGIKAIVAELQTLKSGFDSSHWNVWRSSSGGTPISSGQKILDKADAQIFLRRR